MYKKILRPVIFLSVLLASLPVAAQAGRQCYLPAELKSEQVLRLHSQLMVIAVTCRSSSRGQDLVRAYAAFTHDNIDILRDAEQILIRYYKERFHDDGVSHLDVLRTQLGNEYGQESADDSAPLFCRQYRDKVITLYYDTPAQVQTEVRHMASNQLHSGLCKNLAANTK